MQGTTAVASRSNCCCNKYRTSKKPIKRRSPEMMLELMDERKKKLENAILRMNSDFVIAVGRAVIRDSGFALHIVKKSNPRAFNAIIEEKDTPEARMVMREIINKINIKY